MRVVPLAAVPNQTFTLTLDGVRWAIAVKAIRGAMCVDVERDGVPLLKGTRVLAGEAVIPYGYLATGNFLFLTNSDELPDYSAFGASQFLIYLTAAEIAAIPPISVGQILAETNTIEYLTTDDGFYLTTDTGSVLTDD